MRLRFNFTLLSLSAAALLCGCFGSNNATTTPGAPPPVLNTMAVTVDSGPAAATGQINHAYVTVKVCSPGSQAQCANIDHVLLDTGSWGLRLVGSVLAANGIALSAEHDAQNQTIEECMTFGGGQTWGPVVLADISMAGEVGAGVPVQIMDDSAAGAPPPATCGANGTLINDVPGFGANGVLGIGVFVQDCGAACVAAATPLPIYFGCTGAGACTAENVALSAQVTNPIALFAADNNGVIINLSNPQNANGDATLSGEITFGIATQADNALPLTGLTVLGADSHGEFTATYNGGTTALPALLDSATDSYAFDDPSIAACATGAFVGYYCPVTSPQSLFAVNTGAGANGAVSTVKFAIADPSAFVVGASAFMNLGGGGGSTSFTWGLPFFYGRKIFIAIDQRPGGGFTGPYYAY
jgi:Protein of unknown function (DUF3443)